jgi:hypothetical protein
MMLRRQCLKVTPRRKLMSRNQFSIIKYAKSKEAEEVEPDKKREGGEMEEDIKN